MNTKHHFDIELDWDNLSDVMFYGGATVEGDEYVATISVEEELDAEEMRHLVHGLVRRI